MGEKDAQWGIVLIIAATFFLFLGLGMFKVEVIDTMNQGVSMLIAFVLIAIGVYMIAKK